MEGPGGVLSVGPPRRRFTMKALRLRADRVEEYSRVGGLPIYQRRDGGAQIGRTDERIAFLEFNPGGRQTPTKVRSGGVTGYVRLPGLSEDRSVFQPMMGGILQVFRGDWGRAKRSFQEVLSIPTARKPIVRDALLYAGMVAFRDGGDGLDHLTEAQRLAPYDRRTAQYLIMGHLATGDADRARDAFRETRRLFRADDPWRIEAQRALGLN